MKTFDQTVFGNAFVTDPVARKIATLVKLWPHASAGSIDALGQTAKIVRTRTTDKRGRVRVITEARIIPPVEALLDILLPAIARRDSRPFRWFTEAIENPETALPANRVEFETLSLAYRLCGSQPPFNCEGEAADDCLTRLPQLPISESDARREVECETGNKIDAGYFHRLCEKFGLKFTKTRPGGRPKKKVLTKRIS